MRILNLSILTLFFSFSITAVNAQKAKRILNKSLKKSKAVKTGYLKMDEYFKSGGGDDTSLTNVECYFKRVKDDSISPVIFYQKRFQAQAFKEEGFYDGNKLLRCFIKDSSGYIMTKSKWAKKMKHWCSYYSSYEPFLTNDDNVYPDEGGYKFNSSKLVYIGEETVNGYKCHKIEFTKTYDYDSTREFNPVKYKFLYWVNKKDDILVQYTIDTDFSFIKDTMHQFKKVVLKSYKINIDVSSYITSKSIPKYIKLVEYSKNHYTQPKPLPIDTIAPPIRLYSLNGELFDLDSLKNKVVVIDFFYRACAGCMLAIPKIQAIHDKYAEEGVVVLGVNPMDKDAEGFRGFVKARGIEYPVLLGAEDVAKSYKISAYPYLFVIDRNGKIVFKYRGFDDGMYEELEKVILKHL